MKDVPLLAAYHHEKVNGKGYPFGLTGEKLPLASKILAVADVFDSLTSRRDYPKYVESETMGVEPMPFQRVVSILNGGSDSHFDSKVVDAFFQMYARGVASFSRKAFFSRVC